MTEQEFASRLVDRFETVQSPIGRWRLNAYVAWKRFAWRALLSSAYAIKRGFDVFASFLFLLVFSPLFAVIALLIKLEDGGPIFFGQTRVGRFGREFKMWKFRSMCVNAEAKLAEVLAKNQHTTGVTFKLKNDPRITRVGRILRKLSLDELPQFYNVLVGDMSLVGPRPPVPREVALYSTADRRRLAITPGITCLWQIGGRANIDFPEQVQLDVQYIESQSFWMDLKILLKTVPAVISGRGAC
ncbi:MAG TPA: sugar transferase [Methylomirabilota bacterium]|nr:sugar transferase [Methylomirabilota bacterium]